MYKIKIFSKLLAPITVCFMLLNIFVFPMAVFAYFDRGPVGLSLGSNNVTVDKGQSVSVSATLNPASRDELPGCGMARCPQTCGGEGCINETGDCTCNGSDYQTYYATVLATSADASIATASYTNGVIIIKGIAAGSTTITVQGALRQYSNSPEQAIHVTVTAPAQPAAPSTSGSSSGGSGSSGGKSSGNTTAPSVVQVAPSSPANNYTGSGTPTATPAENAKTGEETTEPSTETSPVETVNTKDGVIDFVTLKEGVLTGKSELEKLKGKDQTVTFQDKDASDNILYSWSFKGKNIENPADLDMTIHFSSDYQDRIEAMAKISDPLFLSFAHSGELPGKATINISTQGKYKSSDTLYLYYYNDETDKIEQIVQNLKVENGYVSFDITHCSDYFLSPQAIESISKESEGKGTLIAVIGGIIVLGAAAAALLIIRKKKQHLEV